MNTKKFIGVEEMEKEFGPLTFARVLRAHRLSEELSQVDLAKLLKISKQGLNDLEKGRKIPSIRRALQIGRKIGLVDELCVQLILQDQVRKEKLNFTVRLSKGLKSVA